MPPLKKEANEAGEEVEVKRPNCITGKRFLGFALVTTALILLFAGSLTIVLYYLIQFNKGLLTTSNLWNNGAFMIFLPIAIAAFFVGVGFSVRTVQEEQQWFKAFNTISAEIIRENKN